MKSYLLCLLFILFYNAAWAQNTYTYISPKPNSVLVSDKTNIILRSADPVDPSSLTSNLVSVKGDQSGAHSGQLSLSDDKKTIIFIPVSGFLPNEMVAVHLFDGIKTADGRRTGTLDFSFKISPLQENISLASDSFSGDELQNSKSAAENSSFSLSADLPADLPTITVGTSNSPAEGKIFLTNQSQTPSTTIGSYLLIYNNDGSIAKYFKIPQMANLFKMEPNGQLSYNLRGKDIRIILDTSFVPADTLKCGNGYKMNGHDALLLPNGHSILFANDKQPVDMSLVVQGGNPNAQVTGIVVQELDASHNVVFQWRSWDFIPITASYFDLTMADIDLLHPNGLAVDKEGNILVSLRHLSSIVKINRETGDVDWILGGKLNQFTFINEHETNGPTYFSYQHNIEVLPNSNITLFDDGTQHSPQYSRGVEYKLDEQLKTATMVWDYRHTPDIYTDAMGSVQRLPNGNTIIGWGIKTGPGIPVFTEVHPDNTTALEMFFPAGQFSYRSYKYPWISRTPDASITIPEIRESNTYAYSNSSASTGIKIMFKKLSTSSDYNTSICSKYNYSPVKPVFIDNAPIMAPYYFSFMGQEINSFLGEVHVDLSKFPGISVPSKTQAFVRQLYSEVFVPLATSYDSVKNELVFNANVFGEYAFGIPQSVSTEVSDLKISNTTYQLCQNYPNPFNPATTITYSIPEQSNVELKVYNILGREVTTLVSKEQGAGKYTVQFDGSSLPSGLYIYTIKAGKFSESKKLVLLK